MSAFVINPYSLASAAVDLKTSLLHYWDLDVDAVTIPDLHGSRNLTAGGQRSTDSTGAPDGGSCVRVFPNNAAGYYLANNVGALTEYSNSITINIWAKSSASSSTGNWLISHRTASGGSRYFQMIARVSSNDAATVFNSSAGIDMSSAQAALDTWQMLTLRKDGTALEFFRNGSSVATATFTGSVGTGNANFNIGSAAWDATNTSLCHRGWLFAAGVWGAALSQAQIDTLYNDGDGLRYADLP